MMVFVAVVEAQSFTLAAERLGIPKANISRKVSRLEKQLNVRLLERSTRSQHLTEAGKIYLTHCKRIQSEIELAESGLSELLSTPKGLLRIGASVTIGQQVLKSTLSRFMAEYPEINLQLNLVNRRVDLIEEGYDLVIRVGQLEDSQLIGKYLGTAKRKIYASPQYLKKQNPIKKPEDLLQCDCLIMDTVHQDYKWLLESNNKTSELTISPRLVVQDFLILQQTVIDGLGIAILPDYMCDDAIHKKQLVEVLPAWGMPDIDIYALYPTHKSKTPKLSAFLEFIKVVFTEKLHQKY
ncbi:MAG: LysR family transcriptional regulator [Moraxellaceae bacterium]|nr:MAG: LysR family transcriptional regulator [Moraxellaceae bacterium]